MTWNGMTGVTPMVLRKLFSVEDGTDHRLNQAIVDPNDDLYTGTFSPQLCGKYHVCFFSFILCIRIFQENHSISIFQGSTPTGGFYRYSQETGMVQTLPGLYKTTNSLGFDYRSNTLYRLDGCQQQLLSFKLNPKTGNLGEINSINISSMID